MKKNYEKNVKMGLMQKKTDDTNEWVLKIEKRSGKKIKKEKGKICEVKHEYKNVKVRSNVDDGEQKKETDTWICLT